MYDKTVDTCTFVFDFVPHQYITKKLCDKLVSENPFILKYCHDRYKTQKMYHKAVDSYLLALKFVPDWFLTSKMIKKLDSAVFSNDYIDVGDLDPDFVTFFSNDIDLKQRHRPNSITLDNINPDNNFGYCDPETISHIRLMDWYNKFKKHKACKTKNCCLYHGIKKECGIGVYQKVTRRSRPYLTIV